MEDNKKDQVDQLSYLKYKTLFKENIDTKITDDSVREFAQKMIEDIPAYFFTVAASSSGKYHPACDLGEGGLVRHSINVMKMVEHITALEQYGLTAYEIDLLKVAALYHDSFKSGTQEQYERNEHTRHEHPMVAANFIVSEAVKFGFDYTDARFIADAIIAHMGQWNVSQYSKGVLPKPETKYQQILHLADYLASRKGINIEIEYEQVQ